MENQNPQKPIGDQANDWYKARRPLCVGDACNDAGCQRDIAGYHEKDWNYFSRMKNPAAGRGRLYGRGEVEALMTTGNCHTHVLALNPDLPMNVGLTLTSTDHLINGWAHYSYALFYGILLDNPISFTFWMAGLANERDVIMSVQFDGGDRYFDLSNDLPFAGTPKSVTGLDAKKYCEEDQWRQNVASNHRIRATLFQRYLDNFWGRMRVPPPEIFSWEGLELKIRGIDCSLLRVHIESDENDRSNNAILFFGFEPRDFNFKRFSTSYSIELFYGIRALCNAREFHFYKAAYDDGQPAIIIEVVCGDGTLQFYDLSNDLPFTNQNTRLQQLIDASVEQSQRFVWDCGSAPLQRAVQWLHRIKDTATKEIYLNDFWGQIAPIYSAPVAWSTLDSTMGHLDCNDWRFTFPANNDLDGNIGLGVEKHKMPFTKYPFVNFSTPYSFILIRGIHAVMGADPFYFVKAKKNGNYVILVRVIDNNGVDEHFYNLSEMEP